MFDLISYLQTIASTYFPTATFLHGTIDNANIDLTDIQGEFIFFERPYSVSGKVLSTSILEQTYNINLFFLNGNVYGSEGDSSTNGYQDAVDTKSINPSIQTMRDFMAAMYATSDLKQIDSYKYVDLLDFDGFDTNASGVLLTISFTISNAGNICYVAVPIPEGD